MNSIGDLVDKLDGVDVLRAVGRELLNRFENLVGEFACRDEYNGSRGRRGVGLEEGWLAAVAMALVCSLLPSCASGC